MEYGILSVVIPLLTITLAIITKDVIVSLVAGIFGGFLLLNGYNPITALIALLDGMVALFAEGWIVKTIIFMLLVGSIIQLLERAGAISSFIYYLEQKATKINSPRGVMLLAYLIGVLIFIESSITALVTGTVTKSLCDRQKVSREKLAYICDATSAPICTLIPLNAWGALLFGLIVAAIDASVISGNAISLLLASIPYNFYAILTLLLLLGTILWQWDIGPMREAKAIPYRDEEKYANTQPSVLKLLLPIVVMVGMVPLGLYFTGDGDILKGSGSTSVYYAVVTTLLFIYFYFVPTKSLSHRSFFTGLYEGMASMLPVTMILVFALLIGKVIGELGTATYLATLLEGSISPIVLPLLIFWVSSLTAFSTGTSWGTFSIMMPIALALAGTMDLHIPLVIAAVMSGGIFGDHASPISDTTIISSMAAGCDHISHVRTQLPYALIAGGIASLAFLGFGWLT